MKKFAFPIIVALIAMVSFNACDPVEPDPDGDLVAKIQKIKDYVGVDSDGDDITATFNATTFVISYVDIALSLNGTWTVQNGSLILTGEDAWLPGIIQEDGKKLTLSDGSVTYSLSKK